MISLGIQINNVIANILITDLMYLPSMVCVSSTYRRFAMTCPGFPCCIPTYLTKPCVDDARADYLPTMDGVRTYLVLIQRESHRREAGV